jgi:hypothetical protein
MRSYGQGLAIFSAAVPGSRLSLHNGHNILLIRPPVSSEEAVDFRLVAVFYLCNLLLSAEEDLLEPRRVSQLDASLETLSLL